jgi:hypothetical protein
VTMKILNIAACATLLALSISCFCQSEVRCGQALVAPMQSGADLSVASLSTDIRIVGTDQEGIRVSCRADVMDGAKDISLKLSGTAARARLSITGDHLKHNNLHIRIEVPRKVGLTLRMAAGAVKVEEIVGNKDIELTAGAITISSAHDWDYKDVNASVAIGAVNAQVYGANKGGFFRAFRKQDANGEYRLYAHLTTGQIDLLGRNADSEAQE